MYLLDTNVVAELRKGTHGDPVVHGWAEALPAVSAWRSAISGLELEIGVARLERRGRIRGAMLRQWLEQDVLVRFGERMLAVDTAVAGRCASLHVPDPKRERDAMIAATALTHGLIVVTPNVGDFEPMGVSLLNPWLGQQDCPDEDEREGTPCPSPSTASRTATR